MRTIVVLTLPAHSTRHTYFIIIISTLFLLLFEAYRHLQRLAKSFRHLKLKVKEAQVFLSDVSLEFNFNLL